jgi:hypothetical protein
MPAGKPALPARSKFQKVKSWGLTLRPLDHAGKIALERTTEAA